jgi:hypothetical protein
MRFVVFDSSADSEKHASIRFSQRVTRSVQLVELRSRASERKNTDKQKELLGLRLYCCRAHPSPERNSRITEVIRMCEHCCIPATCSHQNHCASPSRFCVLAQANFDALSCVLISHMLYLRTFALKWAWTGRMETYWKVHGYFCNVTCTVQRSLQRKEV